MFLLDKSSASQTKLKKQRSNIIIRSDVLQSNTSVRTVLPGSGHPSSVWCGTAGVSLVFHLKAFNSTIIFIIIITTSIVSSLVAQLQQTEAGHSRARAVLLETLVCSFVCSCRRTSALFSLQHSRVFMRSESYSTVLDYDDVLESDDMKRKHLCHQRDKVS